MKELFGICDNCQTGVTFKLLTVVNQSDDVVLCEAQCTKCKLHSSVYFRVNLKDYKPILAVGSESDDHENTPPHSTSQTLIP